MKRTFSIVLLSLVMSTIWAGNVIIYTTVAKDVNEVRKHRSSDFNVPIVDHTILDGVGTITFADELTTINERAFRNRDDIVSITLPNTVVYIGYAAFSDCDSLKNITLPDNLKTISASMLSGCTSLSKIFIPNAVEFIGEGAFTFCTSLSEMVVDPENQKYDSRNGCNAIIETKTNTLVAGCESTIIPNDILHIAPSAFEGCAELSSILLPQELKSVGNSAFAQCKKLTSINIPESVQRMGDYIFDGCECLPQEVIFQDNTSCIAIYADTYLVRVLNCPKSFTFRSGTRWIGSRAFKGSHILEQIEIPSSIKGIGSGAFEDCLMLPTECGLQYADTYLVGIAPIYDDDAEFIAQRDMKKCTIRYGTRWIGSDAFSDCEALAKIDIPNTVEFIGESAFAYCRNLKKIVLPSSLTQIGDGVFAGCVGLKQLVFPENVAYIGRYVLVDCYLNSLYLKSAYAPTISEDSFDAESSTMVYISKSALWNYRKSPIWYDFLYECNYSIGKSRLVVVD